MPPLPEPLTLRGDGLVLRDWQDHDAPALEPVCGEWDVCQFSTVPWEYTPAAARAWIERHRGRRSSGTGIALAITRDEGDLPVGNVNLSLLGDEDRIPTLGYWLTPAARGQGLAARAARLLRDYGFRELRLERMEISIRPENAASHAVAARLGATREGLRRDSHDAGGRRWDMVVYSLSPP